VTRTVVMICMVQGGNGRRWRRARSNQKKKGRGKKEKRAGQVVKSKSVFRFPKTIGIGEDFTKRQRKEERRSASVPVLISSDAKRKKPNRTEEKEKGGASASVLAFHRKRKTKKNNTKRKSGEKKKTASSKSSFIAQAGGEKKAAHSGEKREYKRAVIRVCVIIPFHRDGRRERGGDLGIMQDKKEGEKDGGGHLIRPQARTRKGNDGQLKKKGRRDAQTFFRMERGTKRKKEAH